MRFLAFLSILLFAISCQQMNEKDPLQNIIERDPFLKEIVQNPKYKVQIIYTPIQRDSTGKPSFESYRIGVNTSRYFYPASTVKLPVALLAMEQINELNIPDLSIHSPMMTLAATAPQSEARLDSSKLDSMPTIAHYIKKILLVSDNDAYNRLYEYLGQGQINQKLMEKGFLHSRIIHRLSVGGFDTLGNRKANPIEFYHEGALIYSLPERYSNAYRDLGLRELQQGKAYMSGGERIEGAFDFSYKNYCSLQDLHDVVKAIFFPEYMPDGKNFKLKSSDYELLHEYMSKPPGESVEPAYPKLKDWDNYVKFLGFGGEKKTIPNHIKIYNKVGLAYGYLTDVAYVVNEKNGQECLLAATIYVNENETFNDDTYEYDQVGFEFMRLLGEYAFLP